MRYPNGQPVTISTTVQDKTGTLVDPSTLTLVVQKPDGTQQTYSSPTHDSTGTYHQDIPASDLTQNGHYQFVWTSTGTGAGVSRGEFDVFDPFEPSILSLQDTKAAVNIPLTTTSYDSELQQYLDAIEGDLEKLTGGPLFSRTITNERVNLTADLTRIVLRQRPVISVQTITSVSDGSQLDLSDLDVDVVTGILRRKMNWPFILWRGIAVFVTYTAGWGTNLPPAFNIAARLIIQDWWKSQHGPGMAPVPGTEQVLLPGMTYPFPERAMTILSPYLLEVYV